MSIPHIAFAYVFKVVHYHKFQNLLYQHFALCSSHLSIENTRKTDTCG